MFEWYCPPKAFGGEFAYRWYAKENVREIGKKSVVSPPKKDGGMNQTLKKRGLRNIGRCLGVTLLLFVIVVFMLPDVNKQTKKWFWNERMTLTFWPIYVDWLLRHHTWEWCSPCIYIIHGTFLVMHNRPELYITATTSQSLLFVIIYVSLCAVHTNRRRIRKAKTV